MAPRTTPTQRQRRLGAEIRKMRTTAGMSTEYAAGLLGIDRGKISNIESGTRNISPERLRTLATHCECIDERYVAALVDLTAPSKGNWWDEYRGRLSPGLLDIVELEWHASRIQTIQTVHIPGLLQTEDYARSVFTAVLPALSPLEVELRVAHRMGRQQVFHRESPVDYVGYVHEAALRMRFGGRETAKFQLKTLLEASERNNIAVRIVPIELGSFPGAGHALLYAEGSVPQLDTAQLDSAHGPEFMHADLQLAKYRAHLQWMDEKCLSPHASRDFIHVIIREL
ncbi:helix-turn-helix domain-containing protein [Streptomyces litchfieldiae]|uniref:Helix-turn-helix transcriptional regulator n=1 Tax=Streptomyces litchfieldiae TaxID=3075543 RepID=A0ABU2MSC6_9ACTN|nr:helix-turn-helix transcriptional regulator [Streptomyces sp. DSM 44938]MDT0343509.1 helix-turn-helix transcriptional regulator [Streptomyces sp. DSM 44938]